MSVKLFEVRDRATFIPVMAIRPDGRTEEEKYLLSRSGWTDPCATILIALNTGDRCQSDPYEWRNRTLQTAHLFIEAQWDSLTSGEVVDVEFVLGEVTEPKVSERIR